MEFVKTGIAEFDMLFANKGYPRGNSILVVGGPGTGKSIFGMQFIYKGAKDYNEPGVFVTLTETSEKLRENMEGFGWDLKKLEGQGKMIILDAKIVEVSTTPGISDDERHVRMEGFDTNLLLRQIQDTVKDLKAQRLVVDSLSIMNLNAQSDFEMRILMLRLSQIMSRMDVTSLLLMEAKRSEAGISEFPTETFVFDGVITMRLDNSNQVRDISISKMRGTKHVLGSFKFEIDDTGINFKP